jgi:hypothetical protein
MAGPRAHVIDGMKFMWDGKEYENAEEANKSKEAYEKDNFETRIIEEDGRLHVYTRRVVSEVVVDESPPG